MLLIPDVMWQKQRMFMLIQLQVCSVFYLAFIFFKEHPWQVNLSAVDITTGKNSFYKLQIVKDDKGSTFVILNKIFFTLFSFPDFIFFELGEE